VSVREGIILKALSGFYYVLSDGALITCRARGKFRHQGLTPLVGDNVCVTDLGDGTGALDEILPRKNQFRRPAVANIDQLVLLGAGVNPVTDPFLLDRLTVIADGTAACGCLIVLNKCDADGANTLFKTYTQAGFPTLRVSARTGEGLEELAAAMAGKVSALTGNSGVGKSSILNALEPNFHLETGDVSAKLGRGRHTTRHVELHRLQNGAIVADTPGFSSFDLEGEALPPKEELARCFREFRPYLDECRFVGCSHRKEAGCAVLDAVREGAVPASRHESYCRLYEMASQTKDWQRK